jgi:N-acetylmuramoyl-L-alanine amidase
LKRLRLWLVALFAFLAVLAAVVAIVETDNNSADRSATQKDSAPAIPETIKVDGPDPDVKKDDTVVLSEQAEDIAQGIVEDPGDLKARPGEDPLSGTGRQTNIGVVPGPLATQTIPGCRTRFLKTNFSSRRVALAEVRSFDFHYAANRDIPGTRAEVDGLTAFGNRAASRVSWHFNMDKDGNCDYNVPLTQKAWTIANKNPYSIGIEVSGSGEAPYLREGGYRQMARILRAVQNSGFDIPIRLGASVGCRVVKSGLDTHWRSGACSGGHMDIKPHEIEKVIATLKTYMNEGRPNTDAERRACASLKFHRKRVRGDGDWQDLIRNRKGNLVLRHAHAQPRKAFLIKRKIRHRQYCS